MLIKKATVQWDTSDAYSEVRILFYDKDGKLFESGNVISNNTSYGETENFKVTYDGKSYSSEYYPIYAVLTTSYKGIGANSKYYYFSSIQSRHNGLFTIEFKTIQPISKIKICTNLSASARKGFFLDIYDIYGNTESYTGINGSSTTIHTYDLQVDVHSVNEIGTTETTISSNTVHFLQFKI